MIIDLLVGKSSKEKAQIKATEIAKINHVGEYTKGDLKVEIQSLKAIEVNGQHGVEILARAWRGTKQLGFGDGSVEIERFRIFNPPILVPDPNGSIVQEWTDIEGNLKQSKSREDPIEAIRQSLAHTISVTGKDGSKIIIGKIGNTTSTFFPSAGSVDPVDGGVIRDGVNETFTTIRDGAGVRASPAVATDPAGALVASATTDQFSEMYRAIWLFDTSAIPTTDNVDSAKLSLWGTNKITTLGSPDLHIVASTPASNSNLVAADYTQTGSTSFGSVTMANFDGTNTVYTDITLNASGLANISKGTGARSKFGGRTSWDLNNSFGGIWASGAIASFEIRFADQAGTTNDPKLVVEHSAVVAGYPPTLLMMGVG